MSRQNRSLYTETTLSLVAHNRVEKNPVATFHALNLLAQSLKKKLVKNFIQIFISSASFGWLPCT